METVASPVILTIVLHISRGLSTAKINANPASGIPAWDNTITNTIIPALGTAAVPIEASVAVRIIPSWAPNDRSKPNACAINTAAIACYNAVPSMLIVAPIGRTKLETSSFTPKWLWTLSIVTGRVAALELVENATSWAGRIPFKK